MRGLSLKPYDLPPDLDDRLWSWGRHYRDRTNWGHCGSAEGNYKPHSDDYAKEGWGDAPPPQRIAQARSNSVLEAIRTNEAIIKLDKVQKWSVTYFFCYPTIPRFVVLKAIKRFTGRRLTWKAYLEQVDLARMRLWCSLATK